MADRSNRLEKHPTGELIGRLITQLGDLWQNELTLARNELGAKVHTVSVAAIFGAAALSFAFAGLGAGLITAIALLWLIVPLWAAALIITVLVLLCAALLALAAKSFLVGAGPLLPERTLNALREDVKWAKTRLSSNSE